MVDDIISNYALHYYNNGICLLCGKCLNVDTHGFWCECREENDNHYVSSNDYIIYIDINHQNKILQLFIDAKHNNTDIGIVPRTSLANSFKEIKLIIDRAISNKEIINYIKLFKEGMIWW